MPNEEVIEKNEAAKEAETEKTEEKIEGSETSASETKAEETPAEAGEAQNPWDDDSFWDINREDESNAAENDPGENEDAEEPKSENTEGGKTEDSKPEAPSGNSETVDKESAPAPAPAADPASLMLSAIIKEQGYTLDEEGVANFAADYLGMDADRVKELVKGFAPAAKADATDDKTTEKNVSAEAEKTASADVKNADAAIKARAEADLAALKNVDPTIKSFSDLEDPELFALLRDHGKSVQDALDISSPKRAAGRSVSAETAKAEKEASKSHLNPPKQSNASDNAFSIKCLEEAYPNKTRTEILAILRESTPTHH